MLNEFLTILTAAIVHDAIPAASFACDQSSDATVEAAPTKLRGSVEDAVRNSPMLLLDPIELGAGISFRINMTVIAEDPELADGQGATTVAQLDNIAGLTALVPTGIRRSRSFYRIGITDVSILKN